MRFGQLTRERLTPPPRIPTDSNAASQNANDVTTPAQISEPVDEGIVRPNVKKKKKILPKVSPSAPNLFHIPNPSVPLNGTVNEDGTITFTVDSNQLQLGFSQSSQPNSRSKSVATSVTAVENLSLAADNNVNKKRRALQSSRKHGNQLPKQPSAAFLPFLWSQW